MSRRKQANPRPLKTIDGNVGPDDGIKDTDIFKVIQTPPEQTNGHCLSDSDPSDEYDEFAPAEMEASGATDSQDDGEDQGDDKKPDSNLSGVNLGTHRSLPRLQPERRKLNPLPAESLSATKLLYGQSLLSLQDLRQGKPVQSFSSDNNIPFNDSHDSGSHHLSFGSESSENGKLVIDLKDSSFESKTPTELNLSSLFAQNGDKLPLQLAPPTITSVPPFSQPSSSSMLSSTLSLSNPLLFGATTSQAAADNQDTAVSGSAITGSTLSPSALSSSISSSKTHRRGKRNNSVILNGDCKESSEHREDELNDLKILPVASESGESQYICPICSTALATSHDLTVHIRSHNTARPSTQSNTCTICGKTLSSQSSLDRHMLVHSGERPFQCKYCKMSFTTNGNMHRHMRIHTKEAELNALGVKVPKKRSPAWKPKNFVPIEPAPPKSQSSSITIPATSTPIKTELAFADSKHLLELSLKSGSFQPEAEKKTNFMDYTTEMHLAGNKRPYNFINYSPADVMAPSKKSKSLDQKAKIPDVTRYQQFPLSLSVNNMQEEKKMEEDKMNINDSFPELKVVEGSDHDLEQLHCPVCNKTFLCKAGFEAHLETHPNLALKCNICQMALPTLRALNMHKLMLHSKTRDPKEEMEIEGDAGDSTAIVGFYDLSFTDFSVEKFSLIAKAWCEDNARKSCSSYHNYLCKECLKAFPCKSALKLHSNTHSEEKTSKCPLCEGDFMDTRALHMHMIKHMSDIAFGEAQKVAQGSSNRRKNKPMPVSSNSDKMEEIGKHDFLASFGLTAKIEPASDATSFKSMPKRQPLSPHTFEKRENNNYFAKMGHIYDPNVSPIRDSHSEDGLADFADFAKMLQNLTPTSLLGAGSHSSMPMGLDQYMSMLNPAQMAAFSFPMMPFSLGNSGMSLASMAAMMNPGSLGSMVGSDRGLLTPPNNGSSSPGLHLSGEMSGSKIVYPCKYCDMVFPNYRALKGHTRTHLGLSPYKCNLCTYSSADKSTLIRHLRTHNGERPFQCLVCDFAFTTKANCERHVRKKHGKCMKDDIESAIGYNKYVSEQVASMDSFHSPDTVCKYCGIDFKFFRALKHHLRSHSSCRQKPFQCTKCEIGFSTKANCIRHLQKQHKEISQNQIEAHILVNEPSIMDDADSRLYGDMSYDEGLSDRDSNTPSSVSSSIPPAHTNQNLGRSRYDSPAIKMEPLDASLDGPLDFSVRSGSAMGFSEDAPMDLSMKKPGPSMTPDTNKQQQQQPQQLFECPQCTMSFSTQKVFSQHLVLHELSLHQPEKQQEFIRMSQLAEMESNEKLGNMRLRLKPAIGSEEESHVRQMGVHEEVQRTSTPMRVFGESSQLRKQLLEKIKKERQSPLVNHVADTNYDLASVKTIIDNTTSKNNFHSFLIENMNDSISQNNMDMNDDKSDSEGALVIEEPPVESPMSKADSSEIKSEYGDEDLSFISSQEIRQQIQKAKALESNFLMPNQPSDKQSTTPATKKKRNSYADSPHKLQCPYCTRTFPWVSSLTRHLLTHTGQKPFKCPKCPVTFSTKSNRERHLIRKHGVNMLDPLSRQTMDRPYKCHLCVFSSFSTQGNLLKHYKERHNDDDLPESLRDLDQAVTKGLAVTLTGEERIAARDKALGISNIGCNSYIAEEQMNQNMQEESRQDNSYLCIDENSGSRSENENEDEMDDGASEEPTQNPTPPPPFPPSLPAPSTTSLPPSSLPSSILSQLPSDEAIKNLIKKDNSPSVTGSAEKQINPERDNYNVDKITECWKCGESFISRKLLVRHLKEHSIDLPFKCYLCDASFDVRVECLNHQEKFHSSDWSILKEKNKVETIDGFSKHMDKVVENNLNKVDQGVVLEIPGHNPDDPKMEVVSADYMQRKVYCSLCPKRFWSLQDLRRHMRSHTGERPFECDICQKRFTLKHSMMRHRKKHSDPGSMSPSDDEDSNSVLDDSMGTKTKSQQRILPKISASPVMTTPSNQHSAVSIATSLQFGTMGSKGGPVPILPALVDSADSISGPKISLGSGTSGVFPGAKENKYIMDRERPRSPMATNPASPSGSSTHTAVERDTADILHSLLGVEVGSIDKMLDSADNAALLLGVQN